MPFICLCVLEGGIRQIEMALEGKGGQGGTISHLDVKAVGHRGLNQAILQRGGREGLVLITRKGSRAQPQIITADASDGLLLNSNRCVSSNGTSCVSRSVTKVSHK
jgi:hypothetical protein